VNPLAGLIQRFGVGRLVAILGGAAGVAAALAAIVLHLAAAPKALLYSNLDLKEAGSITQALDQAGIKYEVKGDGSTILVDRDKVASTRLMLSGKGLPTSGSVGYEIFDNAPALGQTDFVQNLNRQRALEGELARTIRSLQGVTSARVHLVMPKRQLFEDDAAQPSASVVIGAVRTPSPEEVRAIRNLVAGATPNLKPERVTVVDERGKMLAGGDDSDIADAAANEQRTATEERIRKQVVDLVEGVVGPGKARVTVSADLDLARVTTQDENFNPDGQVVRSTQTVEENAKDTKTSQDAGGASVTANIPGGQGGAPNQDGSQSGRTEETTNYEISHTTRTSVTEPGAIKRLSVAVAVDGVTTYGKKGKVTYAPRSAEEMQRIDALVRSAVGFDQKRGDQVTVVNVRFTHDVDGEGVTANSPLLDFEKTDILRGAELAILLVVAVLIIFFVARPLLKGAVAGAPMPLLAGAGGGGGGMDMGASGLTLASGPSEPQLALPSAGYSSPAAPDMDQRIDIARIEGQVKVSSVKKVAEFVDKHPDESVSILRNWLHESP
jgi:flagellar M-ring protein FliF